MMRFGSTVVHEILHGQIKNLDGWAGSRHVNYMDDLEKNVL
jgi:hypothetical protein